MSIGNHFTSASSFTSANKFAITMNRNTAWLNRTLVKLLSRQKINSPVNNPSNFSILERLNAEFRGLNQANQNVQDGSSVVKIAKDTVHIIIDVLQDMKSLALNATSATATDEDRQLMQKEMMQRIAAINDIANATRYNGKGLIDGTYDGDTLFPEDSIVVQKINPQDITLSPNENYIKEIYINGSRVVISENKVEDLAHSFTQTNDSISKINDEAGLKSRTNPRIDSDFGFSGSDSSWNWVTAYRRKGASLVGNMDYDFYRNEIGIKIEFGALQDNSGSIPDVFHDQGFSILCSGCSQYINVIFDKNMNIGQGTLTTFEDNVLRKDFRVGIADATSTNDLGRAIFEGVKNSGRKESDIRYDISGTYTDNDGNTVTELLSVEIDKSRHNFRVAKNPDYDGTNAEYLFVKEKTYSMLFLDSGTILATGDENSKDNLPQGTVTQVGNETQPEIQQINVDNYTNAQIWDDEDVALETIYTHGNPLIVQDGTALGEYDAYYIKGMQSNNLNIGNIFDDEGGFLNVKDRIRYNALRSYPEMQKELLTKLKEEENLRNNIISVITIENAKKAIKILDDAIEYAVRNVTSLGAYLYRMKSDEERIFIMEESIISSESTIRDIDTKERIDYAKAHVLNKASQLMFTQANQNSYMVLDLVP